MPVRISAQEVSWEKVWRGGSLSSQLHSVDHLSAVRFELKMGLEY